jgi:hypothetical protein
VIKLLKAKEAIDNLISSAEHVEVQPRESQRCRIMTSGITLTRLGNLAMTRSNDIGLNEAPGVPATYI